MPLRLRNVQVDVDPAQHDPALAWWAAALGGRPRATDEPEYTHLDGVRAPVGVHVQRLGAGPGGYHLDLETDGDLDAELARLRSLGATDVAPLPGGEPGRVLADPAGLPFCLTASGQVQHLDEGRAPSFVHAVVLDVPPERVRDEVAFWAAASEGEAVPPHPRFPEFTAVRGLHGPGGVIGLLVQALGAGPPRVHLDLEVPDAATRDAEVERLVALGATRVRSGAWSVLRAPGGQLVCVVPADG